MVDDQRVGDDRVSRARRAKFGGIARLRLAHAIPNDLAAAKFYLLAIDRKIALHRGKQIRVSQAHPVADRGPIHVSIGAASQSGHL